MQRKQWRRTVLSEEVERRRCIAFSIDRFACKADFLERNRTIALGIAVILGELERILRFATAVEFKDTAKEAAVGRLRDCCAFVENFETPIEFLLFARSKLSITRSKV